MLKRVDEGLPTPKLDDRPEVRPSLLWVATDFERLNSERSSGMGIGPIPVTRMYDYLDRTESDPLLWEEAIAYWIALDRVTMEHYSEKSQKAMPQAKGGAMRAGRNVVPKDEFPEG